MRVCTPMDDKLAVNFTSRVTLKAKKGDNDLRLRTTLKAHTDAHAETALSKDVKLETDRPRGGRRGDGGEQMRLWRDGL